MLGRSGKELNIMGRLYVQAENQSFYGASDSAARAVGLADCGINQPVGVEPQ